MPQIEITSTEREAVNDLVRFIEIGAVDFSRNARQVLCIELLRQFKADLDALKRPQ